MSRSAPERSNRGCFMSHTQRAGGCLCGAVRFNATGEPLRSGVCHCLDCRKTSGSSWSFFAVFPRTSFEHSGICRHSTVVAFAPSAALGLQILPTQKQRSWQAALTKLQRVCCLNTSYGQSDEKSGCTPWTGPVNLTKTGPATKALARLPYEFASLLPPLDYAT